MSETNANLLKNGYSVVSYRHRSLADFHHGKQRPFHEKLLLEHSSSANAFFEDLKRVQSAREWRRMAGIFQFDERRSHEHQNRLSHTGDVQLVGEEICNMLQLDGDSTYLTRAIAALHDMGHMPLGHAGEYAAIQKLSPFDRVWTHDAAGLRIATEWSNRALSHGGLNLTLDTLEGLAKRYWRYDGKSVDTFHHDLNELPESIRAIDREFGLLLHQNNHIEGQIAAIADWIAFTATDIEDGLSTRRIPIKELCACFPRAAELYAETLRELRELAGHGVLKESDGAREASLIKLFAENIRAIMVQDVVLQTEKNIAQAVASGQLKTADDVRALDQLVVGFSPEMLQGVQQFKEYCGDAFKKTDRDLQKMVEQTITDIVNGTLPLPKHWQARYDRIAEAGPSQQTQGALTELACIYMSCVMDDPAVFKHIEQVHPALWAMYQKTPVTKITPAGITHVEAQTYKKER